MEAISNDEILEHYIYPNKELNYYWSDSFDTEFYVKLAQSGFIATAMYDNNDIPILLPEIQFEYALLDFEQMHISKNVQKLLRHNQFDFKINHNLKEVIRRINDYHDKSWMCKEYQEMLLLLQQQTHDNFELVTFELYDKEQLIAGEIGYIIGKTYTSLTGFFQKEKAYNHWGKLQLVLLGQYLHQHHFDFWNLGHASLQYKIDLGATIYSRKNFLKRWKHSTSK